MKTRDFSDHHQTIYDGEVRRILLLTNPLFQSRRTQDISSILKVFERAGAKVEVQETGPNRAAGDKAKQAAAQDIDAVVVCGGDGTVFDALQGLAGLELPLGIIPFGTGNVLAQNLKIPHRAADAAQWLLAAKPSAVPLGKITCCVPGGRQSWFFAMAAGMGLHALMMKTARRYQKDKTGRASYFAAGLKVLFSHPLQAFDLTITTVEGQVIQRHASEVIAVRVAELNLWRPGGNLNAPFLRLASVEGESRWHLAQAAFHALFLGGGQRELQSLTSVPVHYEDVLRVECKPIPDRRYKTPIAVEADGEILGSSCAIMEMAGVSVNVLSQMGYTPIEH